MEQATQLNLKLLPIHDSELELLELRDVLVDAGVSRVELTTIGALSEGQRSAVGDAASLVATLTGSAGILGGVVAALRRWLARRLKRTIKLCIGPDCIEITGLSSQNEDRLIDTFVRAHGGP
ncbi:MAG: hypothetical protein ACLQBX_11420 [Candidatus Limnocylindrales bacterium]